MKQREPRITQSSDKTCCKRSWKSLKFVFALATVLVLFTGIGAVYAWGVHAGVLNNTLQSRNTSVEIVENFPDSSIEFGASRVKQVQFKNTGSSAAFLRVAYAEHWYDLSSNEWIASDGTVPTKNWTPAWGTEWEYNAADGWFYYKLVLPAGQTTAQVLESVTFPSKTDPQFDARYLGERGYELSFIAEVVQLSDEVQVNTSASQMVFGRSAEVTNETVHEGAVTNGTVAWS